MLSEIALPFSRFTHGAEQSSWGFCIISSHKGLCYMGTVSISLIQLLEAGRSKSNDFHMCLITRPRFGESELCCSFQTSLDVSGLNPLPGRWLSCDLLNKQYAMVFHNA